MDIMCGEYGNNLYIYYGDGKGSLSNGKLVADSDGNTELGTGRFTGPAIADIDGDGLKDLLVACSKEGNINSFDGPGGIKFFKNIGSIGKPIYKYQKFIVDKNGNEIRHVYLRIQVKDMDNDGLLDIVTSNTVDKNKPDIPSAMYMYKNIGSQTEPIFDEGVILTHMDGSEIPGEYAIRIGIGDINNDGIKDIFYNSSQHYPGKVGILIGNLNKTESGKITYSVKHLKKKIKFINGVIISNGKSELRIFNSLGQLLKEKNFNNVYNTNNLNLKRGLYIFRINNSENFSAFKLIYE